MKEKISINRIFLCVAFGVFLAIIGDYTDAPLKGWYILSVFISIILSFILKAAPMSISVLSGLFCLAFCGIIDLKEGLNSYANTTVWLVLAAFILASSIINSNLGKRIALLLIRIFGNTPLGLAYSICLTELILAPVVPSNTARGGGIIAPIVNSLSNSLNSKAGINPNKIGAFLILVGSHANLISSAMFLTAMAANPLMSEGIKNILGIDFNWSTWALGAILPGIVSLALLPLLIYTIQKPKISSPINSKHIVVEEIQKIGKTSYSEKIIGAILIFLFLLWTSKSFHGIGTTEVAWLGVLLMLILKAEKWKNVLNNQIAWDTFIWLGGLLSLSVLMAKYGIIEWLVSNIKNISISSNELIVLLIIAMLYFYSMYLFSMLTAHITAIAFPLMATALYFHANPLITACLFAYFSCLCGCLTNYSTGPIIVYFGLGYVDNKKWYKTGNGGNVLKYHKLLERCKGKYLKLEKR